MLDKFTWMHSGQVGAPQMNGAAGSNGQMLQVLDACLIDGFNPQTVTTATKTATTVTLTFGVAHGYVERQVVIVSGATDAALNGKHRVVSVTTNTITIDAVGVAATTGTITTKIAPLEFESIFGSADPLKRAYRSQNTQGTRTVLYLDMSLPTGHGYDAANPAKRAMVSMCEDMTTLGAQINSYTDAQNNYAVDVNGHLFWYQVRDRTKAGAVSTAINGDWVIVGNGDVFYFFQEWSSDAGARAGKQRDFYAFGDVKSLGGDADSFNCMWAGAINKNDGLNLFYSSNGARYEGVVTTSKVGYFIKAADGIGNLKEFILTCGSGNLAALSSGAFNDIAVPNPASQSLIAIPLYAKTVECIRAEMPKIMAMPHQLGNAFADYDLRVSDGVAIVATHYGTGTALNYGYFAFDLS